MFNMNQLTPEEQEYILSQLPNLTAQEDELERQQMLADMMRIRAPQQRMDWASQAARGISGIGSGIQEYRNAGERRKHGESMERFARGFPRRRREDAFAGMWDVLGGV